MLSESEILNYEASRIDELLRDEFAKQGHDMSGKWSSTLYHELVAENQVCGYALGYGMIVNEGIEPERIPFGDKRGGESEYIKGLITFWQYRKPGLSPQQYLKLAIKTAIVQKEEGMSTIGSRVFSKTGERQHFFERLYKQLKEIDESIFLALDLLIEQRTGDIKRIIY